MGRGILNEKNIFESSSPRKASSTLPNPVKRLWSSHLRRIRWNASRMSCKSISRDRRCVVRIFIFEIDQVQGFKGVSSSSAMTRRRISNSATRFDTNSLLVLADGKNSVLDGSVSSQC